MKSPRPFLLSLACVAGFLGCFLTLLLLISPPVQQVGRLYAAYLSLATVLNIICLGNLWMMRKWAVPAYALFAALNQGVYWATGMWNERVLLLQAFIVAVSLLYYRRME